jgi:uncharacterized protein YdaU (DUF1376 family)
MAFRDQPYLPLYVQDFLTDEKLMECSASATGIYIRLLCIMHKSEEYGVILLKQKDKQTDNQIKNFAIKLAKYLPYSTEEIMSGISELLSEGVLQNGGDKLSQKRMIKDNAISIIRSNAGKKGGLKTQFAKAKDEAKDEAKLQASTENEIEYETASISDTVISNKIEEYWEKWKNYKKAEFGFNFNSEISELESKKDLLRLSNNDAAQAMKIIDYSIACSYKKFVIPEKNGNSKRKQTGATPEQIANAVAKNFATDYRSAE